MAYIDMEYYSGIYRGSEIPFEEFAALAERASDFVDLKTFHRIADLTALSTDIQAKVKKATAIYVEQFYQLGGVDAYTGHSDSLSNNSVALGKTNISIGTGSAASLKTTGGIVDNPIADALLMSTGLCYRGWEY